MRDASPLHPDYLFSEAAAAVLHKAAAMGIPGAVEAASTRVWQKRNENASSAGGGGGGGRRVGGVRAAAAEATAAAAATATTAAVDQRMEGTSSDEWA